MALMSRRYDELPLSSKVSAARECIRSVYVAGKPRAQQSDPGKVLLVQTHSAPSACSSVRTLGTGVHCDANTFIPKSASMCTHITLTGIFNAFIIRCCISDAA